MLTAVIDGFFPSPAGGCVTSAPRKITGCWNTADLRRRSNTVLIQAERFIGKKAIVIKNAIKKEHLGLHVVV